MNLVYNEQVKLLATTLNNLGIAMVAAGFIGPVTNYLYGGLASVDPITLVTLTVVWLVSGVALMASARWTLKGMRE